MNFKHYAVSCFALVATLMLASTAFAQSECESDSDCSDGQICEVVAISGCACPPCAEGEECGACECEEEEYSACVTPPITCESDSDCPDYLSCDSTPSTAPCFVDEDGNEDCGDPEPDPGPGYCSFNPAECGSDADCDEGFECQQEDVACAVLCDPDGNCDDEECPEPDGSGYCTPQQIECGSNSDCPSDWDCYAFTNETCSGGGSTGCACPGCEPGEDCPPCNCEEERPDEDPAPIECEETTESYCIPAGWDAWIESNGGGGVDHGGVGEFPPPTNNEDRVVGVGEASDSTDSPFGGNDDGTNTDDGTNESESTNTDGDDEDSGGCSVTANKNTSSGLLATLLLGFGLFVIRRRR